jgi:channel protein (hemolysin III family)
MELYRLPSFYEPFSALSHLLGALIFLILGALLLRRGRGDASRMFLLGIYVFSGVLLLSLSGTYHMMAEGSVARALLERLDHGAIFGLIAGTFTAAHGLLFRGWLRWLPIVMMWVLAIAGIAAKSIFFSDLPRPLGLAAYLAMGWVGMVSAVFVARRHGFAFILPLLFGGLAYSVGALANYFAWWIVVPGVIHPHELFHVAVLIGVFCHYLFVWRIAVDIG